MPSSGLSQTELARRSGVAQSVISAYESSRREPGWSMVEKLVAASGHELRVDLLDGVGLVSLIGLEREISDLLGRAVDVVPAASLKTDLAAQVLAESIAL